jgi:hypothetical protein
MGGQRKKKGGRVTPRGGVPLGRLSADEKAGLDDIFANILRSACAELTDGLEPLVVELWASQMWSIWQKAELVGMDATAVFAGGLINYATKCATPGAVAVLRALAAVAPGPYGTKARRAAEELSRSGIPQPAWADSVGVALPVEAWLSYDPVDDDGVAVMVMFNGPAGNHTVGVYIDHNLRAMAKDAFAVPVGVDEVIKRIRQRADENKQDYRQIPISDAAARWRDAFAQTELTLEPPTTEDMDHLRALVLARLATMPTGGRAPSPLEVNEDERAQLLSEFLHSDETVGLFGESDQCTEDVEHLCMSVIDFSLDCVWGTPLRFSAVMVELFCLDWAPRQITADMDTFTVLPDVLAAWIRFAGRRRGIPERAISESVEAAYDYAPEMIALATNPANWGPAKTVALAIEKRGIDITDQDALDDFIDEIDRNGGIDWLNDSASPSLGLRHCFSR